MKIKVKILIFLFLFFNVGLSTCLIAKDVDSKHNVLVGFDFWTSTASTKEFESSIGFRANYFYNINNKFSLSVGLFYFTPDNKGIVIPPGSTSMVPLNFDFQYSISREKFTPFFSGGLSLILVNYKLSEDTMNAYKNLGFSISTESKTAVGLNIGGGLEIIFTEKYSLVIDAYYIVGKSDFIYSITDEISGLSKEQTNRITLNSLAIGAGIKFNL